MKLFLLNILRFVARSFKVQEKINFSIKMKFGDKVFKIPIIKGLGLNYFEPSEIWMYSLLKTLLEIKEGLFIDVGINIGQTLIYLRSVNSFIEYMGFEPNPNCIFYLNYLIEENSFQNNQTFQQPLFHA